MIPLTIVVNGQQTVVHARQLRRRLPLHTVIPKALEQTGNAGQGIENWELRDSAGTILDLQENRGFPFPASHGSVPQPQGWRWRVRKWRVAGCRSAGLGEGQVDREIEKFRGLGDAYRRREGGF